MPLQISRPLSPRAVALHISPRLHNISQSTYLLSLLRSKFGEVEYYKNYRYNRHERRPGIVIAVFRNAEDAKRLVKGAPWTLKVEVGGGVHGEGVIQGLLERGAQSREEEEEEEETDEEIGTHIMADDAPRDLWETEGGGKSDDVAAVRRGRPAFGGDGGDQTVNLDDSWTLARSAGSIGEAGSIPARDQPEGQHDWLASADQGVLDLQREGRRDTGLEDTLVDGTKQTVSEPDVGNSEELGPRLQEVTGTPTVSVPGRVAVNHSSGPRYMDLEVMDDNVDPQALDEAYAAVVHDLGPDYASMQINTEVFAPPVADLDSWEHQSIDAFTTSDPALVGTETIDQADTWTSWAGVRDADKPAQEVRFTKPARTLSRKEAAAKAKGIAFRDAEPSKKPAKKVVREPPKRSRKPLSREEWSSLLHADMGSVPASQPISNQRPDTDPTSHPEENKLAALDAEHIVNKPSRKHHSSWLNTFSSNDVAKEHYPRPVPRDPSYSTPLIDSLLPPPSSSSSSSAPLYSAPENDAFTTILDSFYGPSDPNPPPPRPWIPSLSPRRARRSFSTTPTLLTSWPPRSPLLPKPGTTYTFRINASHSKTNLAEDVSHHPYSAFFKASLVGTAERDLLCKVPLKGLADFKGRREGKPKRVVRWMEERAMVRKSLGEIWEEGRREREREREGKGDGAR
ncbi:hypothetical protein CAC42_7308 [Sphaceloma murrayae]|uniref:Uncharacterized protein n=1 Tax=Sphaceloma murrayae TaxID=2082308 RepID=A0A2K1QWN2_9PEZI|nr:hypothetical protein CAC42_7308 [Sphaceloma murrayae]